MVVMGSFLNVILSALGRHSNLTKKKYRGESGEGI